MTQDNRLEIRNKKFSVHQDSGCFFIRAPEKVTYEHILCVEGDRRVLIDAFDEFVACDVFEHYVLCRDINYLSNQTVGPYTRDQILNKEIQFVYRNVTDSGTLIIESGDETATVTTSVTSDSDGKQFTFGESGNTITFRERETKNIVIGKRVITVTFISFDAAVFTIDQIKSFGFPEEAIAGLDDISGEITYEQLVPESQLSALIEDIMGETTFENPVNLRMPEAVVEDIGGEVVYVDPYISLQPPQDLEVCPVVDMPTPTPTPTVLPATCDDATLALSPYTGVTTQDQLVVADVSCGGHRVESSGAAGVDSTVLHLGQPTIKTGSMSTGDGHVTYHDPPSHIFKTTQDFTFETWLMFENVTQEHRAFEFSHATRNRTAITYFHRGDLTNSRDGENGSGRWWSLQINDGSGSTSASNVWRVMLYWFTPMPMINNTWHHVVLTRHDNDQWAMYMDGQLCYMQREHPSVPGATYGAPDGVTTYDHATGTMYNNSSQNVSTTAHYHDYRFIERALYTREFDTSNVTENIMCVTDAQSTTCADVVLHLQSDTTDETSDIVDTSVNNHTITTQGDPHHETDVKLFGESSLYFDGTDDHLVIGDIDTFGFLYDASSDYTVEMWLHLDSHDLQSARRVLSQIYNTSSNVGIDMFILGDGTIMYNIHRGGLGTTHRDAKTPVGAFEFNKWQHVAITYTVNDAVEIYVNGARLTAATGTGYTTGLAAANTTPTRQLQVGSITGRNDNAITGYMQDFKISKRAVYTGDCFVVPTELHPVLVTAPDEPTCADVVLQIQSDTTDETSDIVDASVNNHTITTQGDPHHETDVKLFGDSSMYFDGNDDYLSINQSETLNLQGNFTLECWFNMQSEDTRSDTDNNTIISSWPVGSESSDGSGGNNWQLIRSSSNFNDTNLAKKLRFFAVRGQNTTLNLISKRSIELNTWYHVAIVGNEDELSMFINGTLESTVSGWNLYNVTNFHRITVAWRDLKHNNNQLSANIYLQDLRISKKAIYSGDCFAIPTELHPVLTTAPDEPTCTEVVLQIQSDTTDETSDIVDSSVNTHVITTRGDTHHETDVKLFGDSSMLFDGSGDYLEIGAKTDWRFLHDGTTDYTVEFMMYCRGVTGSDGYSRIFATGGSSSVTGINLSLNSNRGIHTSISRGVSGTTRVAAYLDTNAFTLNTWHHVAVVYTKQPVEMKLYVDGMLINTGQELGTPSPSDPYTTLLIGRLKREDDASKTYYFNGYLQDFRISKRAVYTGDCFVAPTELHPVLVAAPDEPTCECISV